MNKTSATIGALQAVLVALVLLDVVSLSEEQIAGIIAATSSVLLAVAAWFNPKIPFGATE